MPTPQGSNNPFQQLIDSTTGGLNLPPWLNSIISGQFLKPQPDNTGGGGVSSGGTRSLKGKEYIRATNPFGPVSDAQAEDITKQQGQLKGTLPPFLVELLGYGGTPQEVKDNQVTNAIPGGGAVGAIENYAASNALKPIMRYTGRDLLDKIANLASKTGAAELATYGEKAWKPMEGVITDITDKAMRRGSLKNLIVSPYLENKEIYPALDRIFNINSVDLKNGFDRLGDTFSGVYDDKLGSAIVKTVAPTNSGGTGQRSLSDILNTITHEIAGHAGQTGAQWAGKDIPSAEYNILQNEMRRGLPNITDPYYVSRAGYGATLPRESQAELISHYLSSGNLNEALKLFGNLNSIRPGSNEHQVVSSIGDILNRMINTRR
jgi:hypothetical protein